MKAVCATLIALASALLLDISPSQAEVYRPWCAVYQGSRSGATNCGFTSYQQCMMTAGPGTGASCVQNPWYLAYGSGQGGNGYGKVRRKWVR
jgi:hypothetical protein